MAFKIDGDKVFVDSDFIRDSAKHGKLEHMGFGEFTLKTTHGDVEFDRMRGVPFEGQQGRSHLLYGDGVGWLKEQMGLK